MSTLPCCPPWGWSRMLILPCCPSGQSGIPTLALVGSVRDAHPAFPSPVGSVWDARLTPLRPLGAFRAAHPASLSLWGIPNLLHHPLWEHPRLNTCHPVPTQVRKGTSACALRTAQPGCAVPVTSGPKSASRCCGKGRCVPGTGGKAPTAWRSSSGASAPRGWRVASSESMALPMPPACTPASGTEHRRTDGWNGTDSGPAGAEGCFSRELLFKRLIAVRYCVVNTRAGT